MENEPKKWVWLESRKSKKRGRRYDLRWIDPSTGKQKGKCVGGDKVGARDELVNKLEEINEYIRNGGRLKSGKRLEDLYEALPDWMAGKARITVVQTKRAMKQLIGYAGNRFVSMIDRELIMEFRAKRIHAEISSATVNKELRQIKSALGYAVHAGWLTQNPLWHWPQMFVREPERTIRVVEPDEFAKLIEHCEQPGFDSLLIVAYYQGLRRAELSQLRWGDVDLEGGALTVRNKIETGELTKSRKNRTVPLRAQVIEALRMQWDGERKIIASGRTTVKHPYVWHWPDGVKWTADWITHEFARVVDRAKVNHCTLHDLRRSFSTLAQRAGVDRSMVKDLGGWSSVAVVERHYTGEIGQAAKRAIAKLDAG